ncbi:hypothetical protein M378DRAFT_160158 [Amanita muscaria Koide BX008]|uniref:Uncharacterized protein n=1 Tax=Amanita muscaria (strain Koide BX008) TaxID=946122 RepID=A0A0C2XEB5_AMAMK|nr:hypothetical protein M378DRAFT_160158 [Amanita muscaria Koide BX008]
MGLGPTAATYNPQMQNMSITLQFTGVAVWVFFILSNANQHGPTITTNTNCNFTLDGLHAGVFVHNPDMSTLNLVYNATAFSATGLSNTSHQLIIMTNDVPFNVFVNFDYAIYTAVIADPSNSTSTSTSSNASNVPNNNSNNNGNSSSSHPVPVPIIVGAVLGALAVIIIASLVLLLLRIRKSKKRSASIMPAPLGSPNRSMTQLYSDDNETNSHLPSQGTVFSGPMEPFRNSPAGTVAGWNSGSLSYSRSALGSASDYTDVPLATPLLPMRGGSHTPLSSDREKLRAIRQTEIDEQLNSVQREMENLAARQSMPPPPNVARRPAPTDQEMEALREQVRMLSGQIEHLHRERQSDWALGLSDEPPPAYTG